MTIHVVKFWRLDTSTAWWHAIHPVHTQLLLTMVGHHCEKTNDNGWHSKCKQLTNRCFKFVWHSKYGTSLNTFGKSHGHSFTLTPCAHPHDLHLQQQHTWSLIFVLFLKTRHMIFSTSHPLHRYQIYSEIFSKIKVFRPKPTTPEQCRTIWKNSLGTVHVTILLQILFFSRY